MASLYERLGGLDAITAVVDAFVGRCAGDDRINGKFERTDVPRLKKMLVDQVCEATGGPCTYNGRGMPETHDGMGVTAGEFDALARATAVPPPHTRDTDGRRRLLECVRDAVAGGDKTKLRPALDLLWASQHLDGLWQLEQHLGRHAAEATRPVSTGSG